MKYEVYLKPKYHDRPTTKKAYERICDQIQHNVVVGNMVECDEWKHTSQGIVVLYDRISHSGQIITPEDERKPKMFIPRENILYIIPKEDSTPDV